MVSELINGIYYTPGIMWIAAVVVFCVLTLLYTFYNRVLGVSKSKKRDSMIAYNINTLVHAGVGLLSGLGISILLTNSKKIDMIDVALISFNANYLLGLAVFAGFVIMNNIMYKAKYIKN